MGRYVDSRTQPLHHFSWMVSQTYQESTRRTQKPHKKRKTEMKKSIFLLACLLMSGCFTAQPRKKSHKETVDDRMKNTVNESTKELREEAKRLKEAYKRYKNGEMELEKFSEVK